MKQVPLLWPSIATLPEEIDGIKNLYANLSGLVFSVDAWEASLLLYQTAKEPPSSISASVARRWRFIACHECVLELFHLRNRLEKIQSIQIRKCPSLHPWIDASRLRRARKKLDEFFPYIEPLRHAIAHRGEIDAHPEQHAPDGRFNLASLRDGDLYVTALQGQHLELPITGDSLERIKMVVTEYLSAFNQASAELERQGHLD